MTPTDQQPDDEPALLPREAARASVRSTAPAPKPGNEAATLNPVARVLVDLPLAHLDRPFDYLVPAKYADSAVPGARVKVRFAGQNVDGFVLERVADSAHRLQPLRRVVSAEPVLSPEIAELVATVAARQAGTRSDVLRLAVPTRHAAVEKQPSVPSRPIIARPDATGWQTYQGGEALLNALAAGRAPRAVWSALPGDDPLSLLVEPVIAVAASGRGALVCVPDHRDLTRLDAALTARLGEGAHVVLAADAGPARRYAAFLAVARGACRIVIGTRAAAFAPVQDLGLVAIWDDGDDLYDEPRAPYPHTREVLLVRAEQIGCAALLGSHARSVEAQYLVRTGWAHGVEASRTRVRERIAVTVTGDSVSDLARDPLARSSRLPREVFEVVRAAIETGPVLVQTPRAGYATRLACQRCRRPATCQVCRGPLRIRGRGQAPICSWCDTVEAAWACPDCGGRGLRAPVLGDRRTAEEFGRAFPSVPVRSSSGEQVLAQVPDHPMLVIATPGAEPVAAAGYVAVVLLDTWLMLARSDLRAAEEALRRWATAAALVRPTGGRVLAVGDPSAAALQALVRWDPAGFAEREILERSSAHLPPSSTVATLTAGPDDLAALITALPAGAEVLGPVERPDGQQRLVVRVPRTHRGELTAALRNLQAARSTRKLSHIRVQVDPHDLG